MESSFKKYRVIIMMVLMTIIMIEMMISQDHLEVDDG